MDVVLLTLTTLSLAAAAGFAALSWGVGREERERSQARIAALAASLDSQPAGRPGSEGPGAAGTRVALGSVFDRGTGELNGRPAIKFAVIGFMALAIVIGAMIGVYIAGNPSAPAFGSAPLELVSMRHTRDAGNLTVSGLVRNPADGASANGVVAVVFAFDHAGRFVASGRAPLDVNALGPGDESPFVVTVPNVSDVARYRVSFRTDRGVIRHVDRRTDQIRLARVVR